MKKTEMVCLILSMVAIIAVLIKDSGIHDTILKGPNIININKIVGKYNLYKKKTGFKNGC